MSNAAAASVTPPDQASDERWARWVAKGVLDARRQARFAIWFQIAIGCGLAAWMTTALMLR